MFRHTTKQSVRSQTYLEEKALKSFDSQRQIFCDSVYDTTYGLPLPQGSLEILSNIVTPLTGCECNPSADARLVFTVLREVYRCSSFNINNKNYDGVFALRVCFVQPEVSSATCHTDVSYVDHLNVARTQFESMPNNPSVPYLKKSTSKCEVQGRSSPYIVDLAGLSGLVRWDYCNAAKSRFFYVLSFKGGSEILHMSYGTMTIYSSFSPKDCGIVYQTSSKCFKITASPESSDQGDTPNKSTCIFLYCDGSFKVVGTPYKAYKVCQLFREAMIKAHSSPMIRSIVESLVIPSS